MLANVRKDHSSPLYFSYIVKVASFVSFPDVAVVHMGFHNKESQPERQNKSPY